MDSVQQGRANARPCFCLLYTSLSLGLVHSQQAMQAQREVTNMTNELLKKNAEMLKTGTIETAKESERGVVDIETLKQTNETLISTCLLYTSRCV